MQFKKKTLPFLNHPFFIPIIYIEETVDSESIKIGPTSVYTVQCTTPFPKPAKTCD